MLQGAEGLLGDAGGIVSGAEDISGAGGTAAGLHSSCTGPAFSFLCACIVVSIQLHWACILAALGTHSSCAGPAL